MDKKTEWSHIIKGRKDLVIIDDSFRTKSKTLEGVTEEIMEHIRSVEEKYRCIFSHIENVADTGGDYVFLAVFKPDPQYEALK